MIIGEYLWVIVNWECFNALIKLEWQNMSTIFFCQSCLEVELDTYCSRFWVCQCFWCMFSSSDVSDKWDKNKILYFCFISAKNLYFHSHGWGKQELESCKILCVVKYLPLQKFVFGGKFVGWHWVAEDIDYKFIIAGIVNMDANTGAKRVGMSADLPTLTQQRIRTLLKHAHWP